MATESRNPNSRRLDRMTAAEAVALMNREEERVLKALHLAESPIAHAAERVAETFRLGGRTIYVGAGTSGRVATMDAAEMPPTFGIPASRFVALVAGGRDAAGVAIEGAEDDVHAPVAALNEMGLNRDDVVIGLAASGTTPYVVAAVKHARQKGVWTCGIANNANTPLLDAAEHAIFLDTGPEVLTGSTRLKAGTSQKLALNRISTVAMVLCGKVIENLMVDVAATNAKLRDRCVRIVMELVPVTRDEALESLVRYDWDIRRAVAPILARR